MSFFDHVLDRAFESEATCDAYHKKKGIGKYSGANVASEKLSSRKRKKVKGTSTDDSSSVHSDDDESLEGSRGGGNTNTPPRKPAKAGENDKRFRAWSITWNNPKISGKEFNKLLKNSGSAQHTFQLEKGKSGTPHFQCCVRFVNAKSFTAVKKLIPKANLQPARDFKTLLVYCSKEDTREEGPWLWGITEDQLEKYKTEVDKKNLAKNGDKIKLEKKLERIQANTITELKEWQRELEIELEGEADDRKIVWVCGKTGGEGKTAFSRYLAQKYEGDLLYLNSGKSADITFALSQIPAGAEVVIFNFTRTNEGKISYQAIEQIKDGIFFSPKYESKTVQTIFPHVVVFANFWPDTSALSMDRWDLRQIKNEKLKKLEIPTDEVEKEEDDDTEEEIYKILKKPQFHSKVTKEERDKLDKHEASRIEELEQENEILRKKLKKLKKLLKASSS